MGWILAARVLPPFHHLQPNPPPYNRPISAAGSSSGDTSSSSSSPGEINGGGSRRRRKPTVAEVRIAIGVDEVRRMDGGNPTSQSSPASSSSSSFMDFLATTPIGQPESPAERSLRRVGEWVAERTEGKPGDVLMNVMIFCLIALPVWLFLLLVAAGVIKLPFSVPGVEDLIR